MDARALPGFATGVIGLVCSVIGLTTGQLAWAGTAGVCALLAGLYTLGLAHRLERTGRRSAEVEAMANRLEEESDQMAARAARFEAEAIMARNSLADVLRAEAEAEAVAGSTKVAGITDPETGLFNEQFFVVTLEKRVSAARRGLRPLAVVLVEVVMTTPDGDQFPADPRAVAAGLVETLRDADTACRLDDGRFALVLEDTPENGAVWTVERVRRRLAEHQPAQRMWAGVACYPAHAFDAGEILAQTRQALVAAKDWRQDRIEIAAVPED
ncbi:MAG: diguanylate cyclase [Acidimicrobiales bacterium]